MKHAPAALAALALLVSGCTEEADAPAKQGAKAAGEVLGGEISDAMIPLEQLESQAPLAPRQAPAAADIDEEQPDVAPVAGIEGAAPSEGAEAAPAAPAPEPAE
jgi:hypothetical protein